MRAARRVSAGPLAVASAVAFAGLYAFAIGTRTGRVVDEDILNDALKAHALGDVALVLVHIVNPVTFAAAVVGIAWFAWARRGRAAAVALAVALVGANVSAALLKAFLGETDPLGGEHARTLGVGFYPSGHVTAIMSIVLAAVVLVSHGRARATAALAGGLVAAAVGVGNVVAVAHHASDVVGAFLLATTWVVGMWAIVFRNRPSQPLTMPREVLALAMLAVMLGGTGAGMAAARDGPAAPVASAGVVCAIALVLVAAVAALSPVPE